MSSGADGCPNADHLSECLMILFRPGPHPDSPDLVIFCLLMFLYFPEFARLPFWHGRTTPGICDAGQFVIIPSRIVEEGIMFG
jgi:hypothetical protein